PNSLTSGTLVIYELVALDLTTCGLKKINFFKKSIDKKNQSAIIVRVLRRYPPKLLVRWSRG
ncbi:hypothetical protein, partial [Streptococcus pyogenes]|uniref:hypothetical protein n=1 Tax=Streptococcus pyogenes TaxID=1314 RepID=UPI00109D57A5